MKNQIIEAQKQKFLRRAGKHTNLVDQYEKALELAIQELGIAKLNQSVGYMRYGVNDTNLEYSEPPSVPDPTPQTPDERA